MIKVIGRKQRLHRGCRIVWYTHTIVAYEPNSRQAIWEDQQTAEGIKACRAKIDEHLGGQQQCQ